MVPDSAASSGRSSSCDRHLEVVHVHGEDVLNCDTKHRVSLESHQINIHNLIAAKFAALQTATSGGQCDESPLGVLNKLYFTRWNQRSYRDRGAIKANPCT